MKHSKLYYFLLNVLVKWGKKTICKDYKVTRVSGGVRRHKGWGLGGRTVSKNIYYALQPLGTRIQIPHDEMGVVCTASNDHTEEGRRQEDV